MQRAITIAVGALGFLASLAWAPGARAQDWATRAVCFPPEAKIHDEVFAPDGRAALEAEAATLPNGTGKLWRITAPNGAVSHLWGTFHSSSRHALDLPPRLREVIAEAAHIALEINPTFPNRTAYAAQFTDRSGWRDDSAFRFETLGFDQEVNARIRNRLTATGWGDRAADWLTLGKLAELLLWDPCADFDAGVIPDQDSFIQTLGRINGAEIHALERTDRVRVHLDKPENHALALAMIATYASYLAPINDPRPWATSFGIYRDGRLALGMAWDRAQVTRALGKHGAKTYETMNRWLVDDRNHDFVRAAAPLLDEGDTLVAVGYFHLPGKNGMVALLRAQGYDVTRIPVVGEIDQ